MTKIDFFARSEENIRDLAELWREMPPALRGLFVVPSTMLPLADRLKIKAETMSALNRCNPVLLREEDLKYALHRRPRPTLVLDHSTIRALNSGEVLAIVPATTQGVADFVRFNSDSKPKIKRIRKIGGETVGILYMCWGEKAARAVHGSMMSLRNIGFDIPICVTGTHKVEGTQFVEWAGPDPYDPAERHNFQFRAGRIKPLLYDVTPFERTLYIDADTEFVGEITPGFEALGSYDIAVAEEILTLGQLYNKKLAGWEINIQERDITIQETGGNARRRFLNSGVLFFRKSEKAQETFIEWLAQWERFQQWDEQLSLTRALYNVQPKVKYLDIGWNAPHRHMATTIFHNYGRSVARSDAS